MLVILFYIIIIFTLTISVNNVIVLINFLFILFIIGYELLSINCIEIILLIVIIYFSDFLCLSLMNGFMFLSSWSFNYFLVLSINSYFDNFIFVCFPCIWSIFLQIGWSRFGNIVFDNDLLMLTVWLFWGVSFNLKLKSKMRHRIWSKLIANASCWISCFLIFVCFIQFPMIFIYFSALILTFWPKFLLFNH